MINYDKDEVKKQLTIENIFELMQEWGGDPEYTSFGIISTTICHNNPGVGSRKLYYYSNSQLYKCYTGCEKDIFDIFELCIKVMDIQKHLKWDLNNAIHYIANYFGFAGTVLQQQEVLEDWEKLHYYEQIHEIKSKKSLYLFQKYDTKILNNFNYVLKIQPWLKEKITEETMRFARIGFYPGEDVITIPHYDIFGNFIGLRGRTLCKQEAEQFGKYRPLRINHVLYSHPLGMNLYGLNWVKENIKKTKKAIVVEAEKSVLKSIDFMGKDNSITVACCGSSLSAHQVNLLLSCEAEEICVAFDRQFQELGDDEYLKMTRNLLKINQKYSRNCLMSFIFDKDMILNYKDSPFDKDKETFFKLFQERVIL